jgi:hypothetical protein
VSQTKFVEFGGRGFWAYDVAAGVFLKHLIDAAEASSQASAPWLSNAVSSWRVQAGITDFGLTLDPDWSTAQRQAFIALAEEACSKLAARESIPAREIASWPLVDDLRIYPRGASEVLTAPVIELGRAIIALVIGQLPNAPEGKTWLYGTPTGRETL